MQLCTVFLTDGEIKATSSIFFSTTKLKRQALQKKQKEDTDALKLEKKKLREEKKAQKEANAAIAKENKLKKKLDDLDITLWALNKYF